MEIFHDNLPGYPDNIKRTPRGTFYVGMSVARYEGSSPIGPFLDLVGPYPALKRIIAKVRMLYLLKESWPVFRVFRTLAIALRKMF